MTKNKCKVDCCRKTTGMKFKPKTADQMEKWKERIGYTGTATADFQICGDHFSVAQFRVDTQNQMLGLPARKKGRNRRTELVGWIPAPHDKGPP